MQPEATRRTDKKKLSIRINYAGREHPFHPRENDTVLAIRTEAMDFFKIVADRDRLRLYRMDNTELNDLATIGSHDLAKHEVLILRAPGRRKAVLRLRCDVLRQTFGYLRACGGGQRECVVYWLGPRAEDDDVTAVVHPRHTATSTAYDVDGAWLNELWLRLAHDALELRAQVHTHPGAAFHSSRDDSMAAIQTAGFLSLVIPRFGHGAVSLESAHLERRAANGAWRQVSVAEIELI